jgi:hypothetical protein
MDDDEVPALSMVARLWWRPLQLYSPVGASSDVVVVDLPSSFGDHEYEYEYDDDDKTMMMIVCDHEYGNGNDDGGG